MDLTTRQAETPEQDRTQFRASFARVGPCMGFTPDAIDVFVRAASLASYRAGASILSGTDRDVLLYYLVSGAVRLTCNTPRRALTVEFVAPGRFFGLGSLFDPPGPRCLGAIAHTNSLVAILPPEAVAKAIAALPSHASLQLLAYSWRGLSRLVYRKSRTTVMSTHERVLAELRVLARDFGQSTERGSRIDLPLTTSDLATLVGSTRASSSRALGTLQRMGVIARQDRGIVLLAPTAGGARPTIPSEPRRPLAKPRRPLLQKSRHGLPVLG